MFRTNKILFCTNKMIFRTKEISFWKKEIIFRINEILFRTNEIQKNHHTQCPFMGSVGYNALCSFELDDMSH